VHRAPASGFRTPFVFAVVELDEGVAMFTNVVDCAHDAVRIGMRLRITFEEVAPGIRLPKFRPEM
jgi:uncharacterized OB-fold protein